MTARLQKIGKSSVISEYLGGEFDFLLIEAPLPRQMKKTKQTVSTGDFNITHFLVELKVAIHSGTLNKVQLESYYMQNFVLEA
jgi:hypothetical protein